MNVRAKHEFQLPPEQQAIRDKCFHPSGTFVEFPIEDVETSIPERFEKIVRKFPDRIAVKIGDRVTTYTELNTMAKRVGHTILALGSAEAEPVGILLEKGVEQVAAMLGVLKAGKFFVLLDPSFPKARIADRLAELGLGIVLTSQDNVSAFRNLERSPSRFLEIEPCDVKTTATELQLRIRPSDHALIFHTSGSTGEPKGVIQSHRNLLHNVMLRTNALGISECDKLSLLASGTPNFIVNMFLGVLNGATLVSFDVQKEGARRLVNWLLQERISVCWTTAPLFRKLCETLKGEVEFPDVRHVVLASDRARKTDFDLFNRHFSANTVLSNALTGSETGLLRIFSMGPKTKIIGSELPIGYAVDDKEILLLDENEKEVGFNEVGEIVVRSRFLSPGYWRRPDLTEAKFRSDPSDPEKRLYYTGDLGLMLSDGCLIHKGRKDFRVKIRGYGVEVGEVEKILRDHPATRDAVVMAQQKEMEEPRLVAYFTASTQRGPTTSELREFLSKKLPDYMIPSAFIRLNALPLMPSGKIDRQALPEPEKARPDLSVAYVAPRTTIEETLAKIWRDVLSVGQVGIHDNFFDLGGHSLSGARLVSLIHGAFQCDLPVSEFFAAPTIAQLATRIEAGGERKAGPGKKSWTYLCELQHGNGRKPVFVFPGGGGGEPEFFVYGFLARHVGTEYPFYGLRARGTDGILQPHKSVTQMADAYVEEIRAIQPQGPYFLIGECAGGANAYEAARQLLAQGQEIAMLVLMDVEKPTFIKYLRFRANHWLARASQFWRENNYVARIPHHLKQLSALGLAQYPSYFLDRLRSSAKLAEIEPRPYDSRQERVTVVLSAAASGQALRHIERVRENYRRTVRRFRPKPYKGHIEILVSEGLYRHDPTLGWKKLALKGLSIHPLPGDHLSYIRDHVAVAGRKLKECLEQAEKNAHGGQDV